MVLHRGYFAGTLHVRLAAQKLLLAQLIYLGRKLGTAGVDLLAGFVHLSKMEWIEYKTMGLEGKEKKIRFHHEPLHTVQISGCPNCEGYHDHH